METKSKIYGRPVDFDKITVDDSATTLSAAKIRKAVFITVEDADIRYRIDGSDATATDGHVIKDGGSLYIAEIYSMQNLSMIRAGGSDAIIQVTYY
jgi:ribose 5-phosphate isomerase